MKAMRSLTRKRSPEVELRINPQSAGLMAARLKSPEGQELLHQLARVYARAAVDELLAEQDSALARTGTSTRRRQRRK